jgi:hypothetical protein
MDGARPQPPAGDRNGGDRIRIQQGRMPLLSTLVGQVGTIVEIFRVPRGSCLVRIDGDPNPRREWFLYADEVATSDV